MIRLLFAVTLGTLVGTIVGVWLSEYKPLRSLTSEGMVTW